MARPKATGPTKRELEILQVLWDRGPSTVREIYEALNRKRKTAYNSVLTILVIMFEKKLVKRDEAGKSHVYSARYNAADMEEKLVKNFMDNVFGGSAMRLVTRALSLKSTSPEEAEKIRKLLKEMEEGHDPPD